MKKNLEHISERELVSGCIDNDRRCQEAFYRQFFPAMHRMCRRYSSKDEEVLEILNSGFLRVFTKLHTYSFKGSLEGWVRRIMFHSIADYYRKSTNKKVHFLEIEEWDASINAKSLDSLYFDDVISLVDRLPKSTRDVFWLYAIEGFTHVEIGKQLGISSGTSKWHLSNARKKLKALLNRENKQRNEYAG